MERVVAALGASNDTYAEGTRTQQVPDWIASHVRAFALFGGVSAAVVCDQLTSGVVLPWRYQPDRSESRTPAEPHSGAGAGFRARPVILAVVLPPSAGDLRCVRAVALTSMIGVSSRRSRAVALRSLVL